MDDTLATWRQYYEKSLLRHHNSRTELAIELDQSGLKTAVDCGCGTGSEIAHLEQQGYQVYGFDINPDSIAICSERFSSKPLVKLSECSFESFNYPSTGIVIANSSLFFADPIEFKNTWQKIASSIAVGGVFVGDFMGPRDTWATNFRLPTAPLSKKQVEILFEEFEIVSFKERDEPGATMVGTPKHWHVFSVVAVKRK
ncbi:SAM-dependent methyltransferase [Salinivibrio kushneri]|uniref:SAM-dependent methyltransferase n=1 Tax=Salinivibrio kushneri TaxID=1908198 RepID=A0AB36K3P6_9GAMM|nr:class I SAM-dependent methyltransferase [Salinivibrio kushneri]OOE41777.1 SAM-dependent methyltransferase [Salinivibrio kushneri]QCP02326.1 class I SAM-dependent methyltransferase [Salinivibrio kushneri]